jgi:hypothetical protein
MKYMTTNIVRVLSPSIAACTGWVTKVLGISLALGMIACDKPAKVLVTCTWAIGGASCSVKHLRGHGRATACWDIIVNCANKSTFTARACQDVNPEAESIRFVPLDSFKGDWDGAKCDSLESISVVLAQ